MQASKIFPTFARRVQITETPVNMHIHSLVFNPFEVNTYLLYDDSKECVIIDPACYEDMEKERLADFIGQHGLTPKHLLLTHGHIDHILGCRFVTDTYGIKPLAHEHGLGFLENSEAQGQMFGFQVQTPVLPERFIDEQDVIAFGKQTLQVLHTPGHAAGSLCFYHPQAACLFSGDVLFHMGIGRTDLPSGDYDTLINSIRTRILNLPPQVRVYPGHGPSTTVGEEKRSNPYLEESSS